ncbi:BZ3500_MvSof-1268-A1-R1_Chr12-3g04021 [Microbotryum saponariae]|uniref:BZ3500_MvSof-1268-A1-R1_Chr12-3g04021 protein n=1 Tax=Microbotryum saponariae TaxID=289078 RepID=A0A2X0LTD5_9BASI|nr:BZ3500_MvSof-1268-A1-R1_Chr12-3g04021 [Microbotryum saponariae]SDA02553.1 BZ3501_MvSof-1269-A2-R1_Chr12-3g03676 [Microbotryum saponariae]
MIVKAESTPPSSSLAKRIDTSSEIASAEAEREEEMNDDEQEERSDQEEDAPGAVEEEGLRVTTAPAAAAAPAQASPIAIAIAIAIAIPIPALAPAPPAQPPPVGPAPSSIVPTAFISTNPHWRPPPRVDCALCKGGAAPTPVDSWDFLRTRWHKVRSQIILFSINVPFPRLIVLLAGVFFFFQTCSKHHKPSKAEYTPFQDLLDRLESQVEHKTDSIDLEAAFLVPELRSIQNVHLIPDLRNLLKPLSTTFISDLSLSSRWHFVYKDAIPTSHGLKFRYTCSQTSRNDRPRDGKKARKTLHKREGGRVEKFACGGMVSLVFDMTNRDVVVRLVHKVWHVVYEKMRVVELDVLGWVRELMGENDTDESMLEKIEKRAREEGMEGGVKSTKYQIRRYMGMVVEERRKERKGKRKAKATPPASEDEDDDEPGPGPSNRKRGKRSPPPVDPVLLALSASQTPEPVATPPRPQQKVRTRRKTQPAHASNSTSRDAQPSTSNLDVNVEEDIPTLPVPPLDPTLLDVEVPSNEATSPPTNTTADASVNAAMSIILGTNHQPQATIEDIQVVPQTPQPLSNGQPTPSTHPLNDPTDLPVATPSTSTTASTKLTRQGFQADWSNQQGALRALSAEDQDMMNWLHQANVDATLKAAAREVRETSGE